MAIDIVFDDSVTAWRNQTDQMMPCTIIDIDTAGGNCTIDFTSQFTGSNSHRKLIHAASTLHNIDSIIGGTHPRTYQRI